MFIYALLFFYLKMSVNYLAVFLAAVVSFVLGMLWYSPVLFGKQWMKLSGLGKKDIGKAKKKKMTGIMLTAFIANLVMAWVFLYLLGMLGYSDVLSGIVLGFLVWIGFFATTMLGSVLWEGKPWGLYVINAGYQLVNLVVIGAVLGAF